MGVQDKSLHQHGRTITVNSTALERISCNTPVTYHSLSRVPWAPPHQPRKSRAPTLSRRAAHGSSGVAPLGIVPLPELSFETVRVNTVLQELISASGTVRLLKGLLLRVIAHQLRVDTQMSEQLGHVRLLATLLQPLLKVGQSLLSRRSPAVGQLREIGEAVLRVTTGGRS